ncbi:MAG: metallopeptidase family protein [Candidatus Nanopelagicales bacterium]
MLMRVGHRSEQATARGDGVGVSWTSDRASRQRLRRRDRRNRGIRGPLAPRAVPMARSRAQRFDEQVLLAWDRLTAGNPELQFIEIAVSDVPEPDHPALAVFDPADAGYAARITVYRWALELRAGTPAALQGLVADVLTEEAAAFLAMSPQALDPGYPRV